MVEYVEQELIAAGGMGQVYRAWDPALARPVALKFLHRTEPELVERLFREARAQARIDHPNVCRVYEVGEDAAGRPFIAMQLVDGLPLTTAAAEMTLEERVTVLRTVARAVHHAHSLGIIHRDLKPGNILVERDPAGGWRPFVVDFGLAREAASIGLTRAGEVMGTPAYMAPEQARGEIRRIDRRTDVYALGAVLFELLAGRPPFDDATDIGLLLKVADEPPPAPRSLVPSLPRDLELVILRCLAKQPQDRYQSALELADDLDRYLRGEPVRARPAGPVTHAVRFLARHRAPSVAVAVLVVVGLAAVLVHGVQLRDARRRAEAARADAEALLAFLLDDLTTGLEPLGRLDLVERVAREAVHYYERFDLDALDGDQAVRAASASARLGQALEQRGRDDLALESYRHAGAVLATPREPPESVEALRLRLSLAGRTAPLLQEAGEIGAALIELDRARDLLAHLPPAERIAVADAESDLDCDRAWALMETGQYDAALTALDDARHLIRERLVAAPGDDQWRRRLVIVDSFSGQVLRERGDLDAALARLEAAREAITELDHEHPEDVSQADELQLVLGRLGEVLALADRPADAAATYRQGIEVGRRLVAHDPLRVSWQRELALQLSALGELLHEQGEPREALDLYRESLACSRLLVRVAPDNPSALNDLSWDLVQVGRALHDLGRREEARQHWQEAVTVIEPAVAAAPGPYLLDTYATALLELGDTARARPIVARLLAADWFNPELDELAARHGIRAPGQAP